MMRPRSPRALLGALALLITACATTTPAVAPDAPDATQRPSTSATASPLDSALPLEAGSASPGRARGTDGVTAPRGSARLADLDLASSAAPTTLRIPEIDVDAPVLGVATDTNGELEVIDDVTNVGWYRYGPAPGEAGSAVLAAHVDTAEDGPGVFFELGALSTGDRIEVELDDGTRATFVVDEVRRHAKEELPVDELFSRNGPARLTLITCGGEFDPAQRSYADNVVVTAIAAE